MSWLSLPCGRELASSWNEGRGVEVLTVEVEELLCGYLDQVTSKALRRWARLRPAGDGALTIHRVAAFKHCC